jgi:hypothetical protein
MVEVVAGQKERKKGEGVFDIGSTRPIFKKDRQIQKKPEECSP